MTPSTFQQLIKTICQRGDAWAHSKGYEWFQSHLLQAVQDPKLIAASNSVILADAWYFIASIYDINNAPFAAIRAHQKALSYDPKNLDSYRNLAHLFEQTGLYQEAFRYINIAIDKSSDDLILYEDKQRIQDCMNYNAEPLFTNDNLVWKFCERLAKELFEELCDDILKKKNLDIEDLKSLNQAYGALGKREEYIRVWHQIIAENEDIELDHIDWFYMPLSVYNDPEIWHSIKQYSHLLKESVFPEIDFLQEHFKEHSIDMSIIISIICDYHIFKNNKNDLELASLNAQYPVLKIAYQNEY